MTKAVSKSGRGKSTAAEQPIIRSGVALGTMDIRYWSEARPVLTTDAILAKAERFEKAIADGSLEPTVTIRRLSNGTLQAIAGLTALTIARRLATADPITVVQGTTCTHGEVSDRLAWRALYEYFCEQPFYSPQDRAYLCSVAKDTLGSLEGVVKCIGYNRSIQHKRSDVEAAREILKRCVNDPENITQSDAQWLMRQIGRSLPKSEAGKRKRAKILLKIRRTKIDTAKVVFSKLRRYHASLKD